MAESGVFGTLRYVVGAALGTALALAIFVGTARAGGLTAFIGALTAIAIVVTMIGFLAGRAVEWAIEAAERRTQRPMSSLDSTHSLRCSLCDTPRVLSRSLLVCAVCDGATSS